MVIPNWGFVCCGKPARMKPVITCFLMISLKLRRIRERNNQTRQIHMR